MQIHDAGRWVARLEKGFALRVIPEPGHKPPTVAAADRHVVVLDGELSNRHELIRSVADRRADAFDDAALVLQAYLRYGEGVLRRLAGTFAVLILDEGSSSLLCARDPGGVYPLFYADTGGGPVFSPAIDALRTQPGVSPAIAPIAVAAHVADIPLRPEETFFAAISRLPVGHALLAGQGGRRVYRYWDPETRGVEVSPILNEAVEQFRAVLHRAVWRCLDGGSAGVFLSGGIDSATVAVAATDVSGERELARPWALSLRFPGLDADEEERQRQVAADLGLPQVSASLAEAVGGAGLLRRFVDLSALSPAPPGLLQPAYDFLANEGRRRGCRVILTGDGGDEWLLPSPYLAADRVVAADVRGILDLWNAWRRYYPDTRALGVLKGTVWKWGARPLLRAAALRALSRWSPSRLDAYRRGRFVRSIPPWLVPAMSLRRELLARVADLQPVVVGKMNEHYKRELLDDPNIALVLEQAFSNRQRLGVHVRLPFLDADVVEFLYRTPPALLIGGGRSKRLAADLVASRLKAFGGAVRTVYGDSVWERVIVDEGWDVWRTLGGAHALSELKIVDPVGLDAAVEAASRSGDVADAPSLVAAMGLEAWARERQLDVAASKN